ncbi:MAG: hypothetical protein GY810_11550 [Aureispira sp.]|nr:hypothetical protein [Aureispira sp.]
MEKLEPSDSETDSLCKESALRTTKLYYFFFFIFCTQYTTTIQAQSNSIDSAQAEKLYQRILQETDCAGALSSEEFYNIFYSYSYYSVSSQNTSSKKSTHDTIYIYKTDTIKGDTILIHTRDTIRGDTVLSNTHTHTTDTVKSDTVLIYQDLPTQQDIEAAKEVLQKVIEDKDLTDLIKETVSNMSSEEIKEFRQELRDDVRNIDQQLRQERANRIVIELGGRRAQQKADRKEKREASDTMSRDENKELIKAKVSLIAGKTAASRGGGGASVADGLASVGNIIAKGIIAIGKGIIIENFGKV